MEMMKRQLSSMYTVKDLGEDKYILGVKIERGMGWLRLSQCAYIGSFLRRFGMTDCKSVLTPLVQAGYFVVQKGVY